MPPPRKKPDPEARLAGLWNQARKKGIPEAILKEAEEFTRFCEREGLARPTIEKYLYSLFRMAELAGKPFGEMDRGDVERLVEVLQREVANDETLRAHKVALKRLFRWLRGTEDYPPEVRWLNTGAKLRNRKLPGELLTEAEVQAMISASQNLRDRAAVAFLWESGCRAGEFLSMQLKDVAFEDHGARVHLPQGKTGARRIRVVASAPHLALWTRHHPLQSNTEAPLWVGLGHNNHHEPLLYDSLRMMLQDVAKRAGLVKKANPHNFRHSRATFLANHLTEAQLCEYFGWTQGSKQPATYVHLSGRDVDDAIDRLYGIGSPQQELPKMLPRPCPRCEVSYPSDFSFCGRCGSPLDPLLALWVEEHLGSFAKLLEDPEKRARIARILAEMESGEPPG